MFKKIRKYFIDRQQRKLEKEFKEKGITDKLLVKQVKLNQKRNKHNISDESKRIYENFVQ